MQGKGSRHASQGLRGTGRENRLSRARDGRQGRRGEMRGQGGAICQGGERGLQLWQQTEVASFGGSHGGKLSCPAWIATPFILERANHAKAWDAKRQTLPDHRAWWLRCRRGETSEEPVRPATYGEGRLARGRTRSRAGESRYARACLAFPPHKGVTHRSSPPCAEVFYAPSPERWTPGDPSRALPAGGKVGPLPCEAPTFPFGGEVFRLCPSALRIRHPRFLEKVP
jgi:hypothetical protein